VNQVDKDGEASDYDEHETFGFLKDFYNMQSVSGKTNVGVLKGSDRCFLSISLMLSMFLSLVG
jgi:hypothetical protein